MNVAARLAPITLTSADESPVNLGELWQERPVVLAFVRHFG
ncbi:MAG: hypothetical protein ACI9MR_003879 [Myxococcota bacterium]|jgi:hypothetical protein